MQPIKTALLSYGMSGKVFHAPFIQLHHGFELAGAWERSKQTINSIYPTAKSYNSLESILTDDAIELVIVNTPTYTHYEYAKKSLLAGKHIVVEKAFTTTVEEAQELIDISLHTGKKIAVYQNRRWDSDFQSVKQIIQSGVLGSLCEVEIHFDRFNLQLSPKQHKEAPNAGAGIVKDLGPHLIDQALFLFGLPQAVFADIRITREESVVDDCFEILLYYPTYRVRLKAGYIVKEALPSFIVHGTGGSYLKPRADVQETLLLQGAIPNTTEWGIEPDNAKGILHAQKNGTFIKEMITAPNGNYYYFYDEVYNALTQNAPMPVTAEDGKNVIAVIEAAFKSSEEKKVITL
ncbi:MAG: Gfo/Idh/MocA family oxidoreductase [Sphingobacteriia bacterium]|nr:Gfo/Idh/MocA family oxidoreductase [Sphingobacteriia bacterium]